MKQYQQLIEKLGKRKSMRCNKCGDYDYQKSCSCGKMEKTFEPILIGDVLEKMKEKGGGIHKIMGYMELVKLWQDCGFTKSLQNINDRESNNLIKQLSPQATELLDFIISLNLK